MDPGEFTRITRTFTQEEMKALEATYLPPEIKPREIEPAYSEIIQYKKGSWARIRY